MIITDSFLEICFLVNRTKYKRGEFLTGQSFYKKLPARITSITRLLSFCPSEIIWYIVNLKIEPTQFVIKKDSYKCISKSLPTITVF